VLPAASVPRAVLTLVGGAVSDRFSPRTSMLVGGLARALVMGNSPGSRPCSALCVHLVRCNTSCWRVTHTGG
jgi:hypothetical protein